MDDVMGVISIVHELVRDIKERVTQRKNYEELIQLERRFARLNVLPFVTFSSLQQDNYNCDAIHFILFHDSCTLFWGG